MIENTRVSNLGIMYMYHCLDKERRTSFRNTGGLRISDPNCKTFNIVRNPTCQLGINK
jgi:hypothetical protein